MLWGLGSLNTHCSTEFLSRVGERKWFIESTVQVLFVVGVVPGLAIAFVNLMKSLLEHAPWALTT